MSGRSFRIGMFVHTLDDRAVARHVTTVAERLRIAGHRVTLICALREPTAAVPSGLPVVDLRLGRRRTAFGIAKLASWLRRNEVDALFGEGNGPSRAALAARMLVRRPLCVVAVERIHYSSSQTGRLWRDRLTGWLYARADAVAGVSESVVRDLEGTFPGMARRTTVLRPPGPRVEEVRARAETPPDHPWFRDQALVVLTSVGNLIPRKGQDVLVEALGLLKDEMPELRMVFVGRRDDTRFVAQLEGRATALGVDERLWFVGFRAEPLPFMRHASLFALASRSEGSPNVLVEALACGVPVIATDAPGGSRDVLEAGAAGLLVPLDDPAAMASAISRLARDEPLRARFVERGLQRSSDFDPDRIAQRHVELVEQCLSHRGRATAR